MYDITSRETFNALSNWLTDARTLASPGAVDIRYMNFVEICILNNFYHFLVLVVSNICQFIVVVNPVFYNLSIEFLSLKQISEFFLLFQQSSFFWSETRKIWKKREKLLFSKRAGKTTLKIYLFLKIAKKKFD